MNDLIANLFDRMPRLEAGHVWLAGAGPGDPSLLTLEVLSALQQADALVHDSLISAEVLALAPDAERFFAGKRGGKPSVHQHQINDLMVSLARQGRKIVRLKGGDPFVFARGGEEAHALADHGIPYRVLPGITSAFGALASVGIPATMRGTNSAITLAAGYAANAHERPDWATLAKAGQPIIIYMGLTHLAAMVDELRLGGMAQETMAAFIENATLPQERMVKTTLGALVETAAREKIISPALVVIGGIVGLHEKLRAGTQ